MDTEELLTEIIAELAETLAALLELPDDEQVRRKALHLVEYYHLSETEEIKQ